MCESDMIDAVSLLNPDMEEESTYLWETKRIEYIVMTPALAEVSLKAGYHQFNQLFISGHTRVYLQLRAENLFGTRLMDKNHASYRRLRMEQRDIVVRCIERLERLYKEHAFLGRAE